MRNLRRWHSSGPRRAEDPVGEDEGQGQEEVDPVGRWLAHPAVLATYVPLEPETSILELPLRAADDATPIEARQPPPELWPVSAGYERGVHRHVRSILDSLTDLDVDLERVGNVLDFGCGTGRLLLGLHHGLPEGPREFWGVDISAARIDWARRNLSPTLRFATGSTFPHLPFEDGRFDLIVAGSVFTHISDLADSWLLELLRVTRPTGHLFLTIQDEAYIRATRARKGTDWLSEYLDELGAALDRLGRSTSVLIADRGHPDAMVFHSRAALIEEWSAYAEVRASVDFAYDCQSALILRKRPPGAPDVGVEGPPRSLSRPSLDDEAELLFGVERFAAPRPEDSDPEPALPAPFDAVDVHWLTLDVAGTVCDASPGAAVGLGLAEADLLGSSFERAQEAFVALLGPLHRREIIDSGPDLFVYETVYGETRVVLANAARRDADGVATRVQIFFTVDSGGSS